VGILVGEATRSRVQDVVFREIDRIKVKGKDEAITIHEPLGLEGEISRDELRLWGDALHAYRARDWDAATMSLGHLLAMSPRCALYGITLQKVQAKRRHPPPSDWDGVTVFDEK
jgi:adenylate cyclase